MSTRGGHLINTTSVRSYASGAGHVPHMRQKRTCMYAKGWGRRRPRQPPSAHNSDRPKRAQTVGWGMQCVRGRARTAHAAHQRPLMCVASCAASSGVWVDKHPQAQALHIAGVMDNCRWDAKRACQSATAGCKGGRGGAAAIAVSAHHTPPLFVAHLRGSAKALIKCAQRTATYSGHVRLPGGQLACVHECR